MNSTVQNRQLGRFLRWVLLLAALEAVAFWNFLHNAGWTVDGFVTAPRLAGALLLPGLPAMLMAPVRLWQAQDPDSTRFFRNYWMVMVIPSLILVRTPNVDTGGTIISWLILLYISPIGFLSAGLAGLLDGIRSAICANMVFVLCLSEGILHHVLLARQRKQVLQGGTFT